MCPNAWNALFHALGLCVPGIGTMCTNAWDKQYQTMVRLLVPFVSTPIAAFYYS